MVDVFCDSSGTTTEQNPKEVFLHSGEFTHRR
jgi:hypothetical protein